MTITGVTKSLFGMILIIVGIGLMNTAGPFDIGEFITGFTSFFSGCSLVFWGLSTDIIDDTEYDECICRA